MSELADWLALIVSIGSLVVAVIALRRTSHAETRLLAIEEIRERDRVIHGKRARLTGTTRKDEHARFILEISNNGEAEAQNVSVVLDGLPLHEHPVIPKQRLPNPPSDGFTLGPASHVRYILGPTQQTRGPFTLLLRWADESGQPGDYKTTLSIF